MKAKSRQISIVLTTLALGVAASLPQSVSAATLYSVLDLGSIGESDDVSAAALNDLGQVVGVSVSNQTVTFRTAPNRPVDQQSDLINPNSVVFPSDINNLGQIVGVDPLGRQPRGFVTNADGTIKNIIEPLISANAINDSGQIAGRALVAGCSRPGVGCPEPARYNGVRVDVSDTGAINIVDLGVSDTANGINDLGEVVAGQYRTAPNSVVNPATDDIGSLGGGGTSGVDINNLGQVVGTSLNTSGQNRAFRTAANTAINPETDDLGTLGGKFSKAIAINELGQVVGSSALANGDARAFVYDEGKMLDLNDLLIGDLDFTLTDAVGINEKGQILVNSSPVRVDEQGELIPEPRTGDRKYRAFLLTPVPEPASMLGVLAFGAGAGILRKKAKQK